MAAPKPAWEVQYMQDHAKQLVSGPITFTPEQRKLNLDFLSRVRSLLPCDDEHKLNDCDLLYRFLIGKHWDLDVAEQFFREYVKMREERHLKGIVGEKMFPALEDTMSPTFGTSLEGLPILWISPDPEKLVAAVKNYSSEEVIRTQIRVMEMSRLAQLHSGKDRNLCIIDLAKISMSTMNSMVMSFVRALSKVLQEYYPEVFRRIVIYNTGWAVTGIWKLMKPFVDARVQDKVKFFNCSATVKSLGEFMAPNQVLPRYGGQSPSNTVSELIDQEIKRIRAGPAITAPPVTTPGAATTTTTTSGAAVLASEPSAATVTGQAPLVDDNSASLTPPDDDLAHESPRVLDTEADAFLDDETVHDSQLYTMHADTETYADDDDEFVRERRRAAGALATEDPRMLVGSPMYPPHHNLSILTTGAEFPTEPSMMRGLSAVYDDPTVTALEDIQSCDLYSIDSASDDYDHFEQSLSLSLAPGGSEDAATPPQAQTTSLPAGASKEDRPSEATVIYSADLKGSTRDARYNSERVVSGGTGSVQSPTMAKTPAAFTRHADPVPNTTASAPAQAASATATAATGTGATASPTSTTDPMAFPTTVQISLTQRADGTVLGYVHNKLIAECRNSHILSTEPPRITTPTGLSTAEDVTPYKDPSGGSGRFVVGQLLVESGHPVHEFVLVCDASRHARFIVRKSRFRSRLTIFQVVGDAIVATDEKGQHYIEGERVRLAVGVPHRNGVSTDWMLYGEDLSSGGRARRKVRDLANTLRATAENDNNDESESDDASGSGKRGSGAGTAHPNRKLLAACRGQSAEFYGILASTHPLALFTLCVAVDRMWKDDIGAMVAPESKSKSGESRDVVSTVKAFFRSSRRNGDEVLSPGPASSNRHTASTDGVSEESSRNFSPTSSGSARRFFKKLAGKE